jgi:hypothetical protein
MVTVQNLEILGWLSISLNQILLAPTHPHIHPTIQLCFYHDMDTSILGPFKNCNVKPTTQPLCAVFEAGLKQCCFIFRLLLLFWATYLFVWPLQLTEI